MSIINTTTTSRKATLALALLFSASSWNLLQANTYIVSNTSDSGAGSLRKAIHDSNNNPGPDTVTFTITGTPPFVIQPATDLPHITDTITIDGYTQPGSSVNTHEHGDNAILTIVLNGSNYTVGDGQFTGNGLHFARGSDGSLVRGLVINEWLLNGILVDGTKATIDGIQINGNFIGTNPSATQVSANRTGIAISGATNPINNTVIGTTERADRNIIAGSFGYMILDGYTVRGGCISTYGGNGTLIKNNYIGTDHSGSHELGHSQAGVVFMAETASTIGGASHSERNLISGHRLFGVDLTGITFVTFLNLIGCTQCVIQGNYIGTDLTGAKALGNKNAGVAIDSLATNTSILNNVISGNRVGLRLGQASLPGAAGTIVQGNNIGTDFSGTKPLKNTNFGIIANHSQNTIGGILPAQRNVISGNEAGGIFIYGVKGHHIPGPTNSLVESNYIGTDFTGTLEIPNGGDGIQLGTNGPRFCAAEDNSIGS